MTAPSTATDVAQLREQFTSLSAKRNAITKRAGDIKARLSQIDEELPVAIAYGDEQATALRSERASLQAELPDLDKAEGIASRRADDAERDLARAELPARLSELNTAASEYRRTIAQLQRDARRFVACRGIATQCFGRADLGGKESPSHPLRVKVGEFQARVLAMLADVSSDLEGE